MFVVSVTLFTFLQAMEVRMLDPREGTVAQPAVMTFDSMLAFVLSQLPPDIRRIESLYPPLPACRFKVSMRSD
jgi:hypothetical protein